MRQVIELDCGRVIVADDTDLGTGVVYWAYADLPHKAVEVGAFRTREAAEAAINQRWGRGR